MSIVQRSAAKELPVTPKRRVELERQRPKRYLVLGSDGHGRAVEERPWEKLGEVFNVADYNVVILNFAAFGASRALAEGFPVDRLPERQAMTRLLFSEHSEVIAIGDPATLIGPPPPPLGSQQPYVDTRERADYWLPSVIETEDNEGATYSVIEEEWEFYFDNLSGYRWFAAGELRQGQNAIEYFSPVNDEPQMVDTELRPLAQTRFGKALGLRLEVLGKVMYRYNPPNGPAVAGGALEGIKEVLRSGPVFWLPAPDRVSASEAIDLILSERYGVRSPARTPAWLKGYSLPVEAPIAAEIERLEAERRSVDDRSKEAHERADQAARPRALLFEKGETLEIIVRQTLRELGTEVTEPAKEGVEDGRLSCCQGDAVLEIKGRKDQIKQADVRQVVQWASDVKLAAGVEHKPLLIGNPHCETAPTERGEPLGPNGRAYAENGGVAVLSTVQLFEALRRKQEGSFDPETFWSAVFAANGVVELPGEKASDGGRLDDRVVGN
jgi:hypothetical protein